MSALTSPTVLDPHPAPRTPQHGPGFSFLDLLITLLVLVLILLVAVYQFPAYERSATPPPAQEQPATTTPSSAPPQ
jgi:hypothetical protein